MSRCSVVRGLLSVISEQLSATWRNEFRAPEIAAACDDGRRSIDHGQSCMKFEYNGRWIRVRLELFPAEFKFRRLGSSARTLGLRRRLLRQLNQKFQQTSAWLEQ